MAGERGEETRIGEGGREGGRVGVQDMNGIWNMKYEYEYKKGKRKRIENSKIFNQRVKELLYLQQQSPLTHNPEFPTPPPPLILPFFSSSPLFTFPPLTFSLLSKNSPTSHTNNPPQSNFPTSKNLLLPPLLPEIPLHRNNTKSKVK